MFKDKALTMYMETIVQSRWCKGYRYMFIRIVPYDETF